MRWQNYDDEFFGIPSFFMQACFDSSKQHCRNSEISGTCNRSIKLSEHLSKWCTIWELVCILAMLYCTTGCISPYVVILVTVETQLRIGLKDNCSILKLNMARIQQSRCKSCKLENQILVKSNNKFKIRTNFHLQTEKNAYTLNMNKLTNLINPLYFLISANKRL